MKKYLLAMILVSLAVLVLPTVSASASIDVLRPINDTNHTGTVDVSCIYVNGTDITSPVTASSNWTYNDTAMAHTGFDCTADSCNATVDISVLTDGIYTIRCTLGNATSNNFSGRNATGVMFDSSDPTCTIDLGHKTMPWKGIQQVDWTSSDAIELLSTAVTIDGPEDQTTLTYTNANRELTMTSQDTKYRGDWTFGLLATDRAGNTETCNETWKTYLPDGVGWEEWDEEEKAGIPGWLIVVAIIGVIYLISKKK